MYVLSDCSVLATVPGNELTVDLYIVSAVKEFIDLHRKEINT